MGFKYLKRQVANRSGQAMAEFVIIMPVLLLIFLAIIFFGKAYLIKANTYTAARYYTWNVGRKVKVNRDKLNKLFFQGDPSKITIGKAAKHNIAELDAGLDNNVFGEIGEIFNVFGDTTRRKVTYALGPIPFQRGEVKISSSHYVDIDPWKGMSPVAWALTGIGLVLGLADKVVKIPCPAGVGEQQAKDLVIKLLKEALGKKVKEELKVEFEEVLKNLKDEIFNDINGFIQEEVVNKFESELDELESEIKNKAFEQLDGVVKGIKGLAFDQFSGIMRESREQVKPLPPKD